MIKYIALLFLFFAGSAFAQTPTRPADVGFSWSNYIRYPSTKAMCDKYALDQNTDGGKRAWACVSSSDTPTPYIGFKVGCTYTATGSSPGASCGGGDTYGAVVKVYYCTTGENVTYINGLPTCPGLPPPPPCSDTANNFIVSHKVPSTSTSSMTTTRISFPTAYAGCKIAIVELIRCFEVLSSGQQFCNWKVHRTGEVATGADGGVTDPAPSNDTDKPVPSPPIVPPTNSNCPKGTVQAGIDQSGTPICVGTGTAPRNPPPAIPPAVTKPPVTVTNPDGSTTVTKETETTNSDGSKTVTKVVETTAADGTKSSGGSTVTGATPSGVAGTADSTQQTEKNDLCSKNPMLAICRISSVTGVCGDIMCEGDAIQCSTLRAAAKMECRQQKDEDDLKASPLTALGESGIAGNDPLKSTFPTVAGASVVQLPSQLDATAWLGNGQCFADKTITVQGRAIKIPLSSGCDALLVLRYALMVVAGLVSFKILSGAIFTAG
jgi:hypothetical protein